MPPQGRTNFQTSPRDRFVDTQDSVEKLGEQLVIEIWLDDSELQWLAKKVVVPDWRFFVGGWVMWSSLSLGTEEWNIDHPAWRTDPPPPACRPPEWRLTATVLLHQWLPRQQADPFEFYQLE